MATSALAPSHTALVDDRFVPEELIGRLYRASETVVLDAIEIFSPQERANLAAHCWRKSHLHGVGLMIAATCDQTVLIQTLGTALGSVLFAQSRERTVQPERVVGNRGKITLSRGMLTPLVQDADLDLETAIEPDSAPSIAPESPFASVA
jgi:hypothetical protein